jgi:hypothetical protein
MSDRPLIVTRVSKTGPYDRPWSLLWQTRPMPAPAFWYYRTKDEADREAEALRNRHEKGEEP